MRYDDEFKVPTARLARSDDMSQTNRLQLEVSKVIGRNRDYAGRTIGPMLLVHETAIRRDIGASPVCRAGFTRKPDIARHFPVPTAVATAGQIRCMPSENFSIMAAVGACQ